MVGTMIAGSAMLLLSPATSELSAEVAAHTTVAAHLPDSSANSTTVNTAAGGTPLAWVTMISLGLCHASVFPSVLTHAERCMRVSGRVASIFVVSGAAGEALVPFLVALA